VLFRSLAIALGFAGVLIIVRPGFEGFSVYSLLALASVVCCAVRDLATKRIPHAIPTMLVSTATALAMTVFGALLLSPMGGWTPMSARATALLALAAVLVLIEIGRAS
ncbi:EamA/RhaT family transporter, partial [Mesorhizobium sp. M3A.F.Ca.ET.175.01.1.1]